MTTEPDDHTRHTVLVVYASAAGSTAEIAEFIGNRMRDSGLQVQVASVADGPDPANYDAAVLGSAVHNRALLPEFNAYIRQYGPTLRRRPTWLFSVGMAPGLRGPLGYPLKHVTPPAITQVRNQLHPCGFQQFAGVFARPDELGTRVVVRLLGARFGDQRDWPAIGAWTDAITTRIDTEHRPTRFPAARGEP